MSVIVYGMEMPEHCGYCRFRYDGICHALQKTQYSMAECPLVPVPPHGNLIDREPFIQFIKTHWDSYDQWFVDQLEARPTVIPAEEGEA